MAQQVQERQDENTEQIGTPTQDQTQVADQPTGSSNETEQGTQNQQAPADQPATAESGEAQGRLARGRRTSPPTYAYNPQAAVQAGLLHLATSWKDAGASYQAINAYTEILTRYPGTGAAAAASEGLLDLANKLEQEGRFYAALGIFHKLEALV